MASLGKGIRVHMNDGALDALTRLLTSVRSRRSALQASAVGALALLGGALADPELSEARSKRKTLKSRRKQQARKKDQRKKRQEKKERRRKRRQNSNACNDDQQLCNDVCIGLDQCCTSTDCAGAAAGQCVDNVCQAAFQTCANADGAVSFVTQAPGSPPESAGAAQFTVGPDPAVLDWAHLRNADFAGAALADVHQLEYSVYQEPLDGGSCPTFSPYMALYTAAGGTDHILVAVPERTPADCNTWQTIDAVTQEWWMPLDPGFAPQSDPRTLAEIVAEFPGMTIRNAVTTDAQCPTALGGVRLEYGEFPGGGGTGNATAYVSYLKVHIGNTQETYLF